MMVVSQNAIKNLKDAHHRWQSMLSVRAYILEVQDKNAEVRTRTGIQRVEIIIKDRRLR